MINNKKNQRGAILIEAILALTVAVFITTALVTALVNSMSNSSFSNNQTLASGYAQEGLEILRDLRDRNYATFSGRSGYYCLNEGIYDFGSSTATPDLCTLIDGTYSRAVYVNSAGVDSRLGTAIDRCKPEVGVVNIFVASVVVWSDSKCVGNSLCRKVELNSCFTNLNSLDGL